MILVDKSIKERSGEIFCEGYAEKICKCNFL